MLDMDGPNYQPDYGDYSGGMMQQGQAQRPSFMQAFQAGMQQNPKKNKLFAGLAGQAGGGGFVGGLGNVAKFFL
jgi:hypothetical protein